MSRILLDVDGVSADFIGKTFHDLAAEGGPRHTAEDLTEWDLHTLVSEEWDPVMENFWHRHGWVAAMDPYPGAAEGIQRLRDAGHEVYFLTTAMHTAPYWMWERYQWLRRNMGADGRDVLFAAHKHLVGGDIFVDDKPDNILKWQKCHEGRSVLWAQPWNRAALYPADCVRTSRWEDLLSIAAGDR